MNPGTNSHLYLLITYLYLGYAEGARLMLRFGKGSMCSAVRVSKRAPRPSHLRVKFLTFPNFPKFQMLLKITSKKKKSRTSCLGYIISQCFRRWDWGHTSDVEGTVGRHGQCHADQCLFSFRWPPASCSKLIGKSFSHLPSGRILVYRFFSSKFSWRLGFA